MSTNYYASPSHPSQFAPPAPQQKLSSLNLWRDGKQIVVVGNQFVFPTCCVMTGSTQNLIPKQHTVKYLPNGMAWMIMFGAIGAAIAQATMGRQLELNLPISNDWLAKKQWHSRLGLMIALASGAVFLLSLVGIFFFEPRGGSPAELILIPMGLGMFTGIGALIYMAIAGSVNLLGCSKMNGNCVWLTGASPEFLAHLPDWSTQGPLGAPGVLRRT